MFADWSNSAIASFAQIAGGMLTVIFTITQVYPLVLVALAVRKRLTAAHWLVAIFAFLKEMIFVAQIALAQGSRFTHWTVADRLDAPLFTVYSNPFTAQTIANTLLLLAIIYAIYRYSKDTMRRQGEMEAEFKSAREVQQVLIPEAMPPLAGYAVTSSYRPAQEVGGDFFQIIPLNGEEKDSALIVLGDVSGKGLKAALAVSLIVGTLRTLIVAESDYEEYTAVLKVGDHVVLYTDGLLEARTRSGELFGFQRLSKLVARRPNAEQMTEVAQRFGQEDDSSELAPSSRSNISFSEDMSAIIMRPSLRLPLELLNLQEIPHRELRLRRRLWNSVGGDRAMNATRVCYILDSVPASVEKAEEAASEAALRAGFDEDACGRIALAVREATINAIVHGNRNDAAKHVTVSIESTPERLTIAVRDEGAGMDPAAVADPLDPANLLKGSGRGIFLIRAFMDRVEFPHVSRGTEICMTKFIEVRGHNNREPIRHN